MENTLQMTLKNCGQNTNFDEVFTEIGHFYTNKAHSLSDLNYLKEFDFRGCRTALFIDDYSFIHANLLNIASLQEDCQQIIGKRVEIFYESKMIEYTAPAPRVPYNEFYRNGKPTCFHLSYLWTMFRLNNAPKIWTIVEKRYQKLEEKVVSCLPPDLKHKTFYHFI